jgi:hypothetical protein
VRSRALLDKLDDPAASLTMLLGVLDHSGNYLVSKQARSPAEEAARVALAFCCGLMGGL